MCLQSCRQASGKRRNRNKRALLPKAPLPGSFVTVWWWHQVAEVSPHLLWEATLSLRPGAAAGPERRGGGRKPPASVLLLNVSSSHGCSCGSATDPGAGRAAHQHLRIPTLVQLSGWFTPIHHICCNVWGFQTVSTGSWSELHLAKVPLAVTWIVKGALQVS